MGLESSTFHHLEEKGQGWPLIYNPERPLYTNLQGQCLRPLHDTKGKDLSKVDHKVIAKTQVRGVTSLSAVEDDLDKDLGLGHGLSSTRFSGFEECKWF